MKFLERQLVTYTAWLCRTFGVTPRQIIKGRVDNDYSFVPRPEGSLGNYW